ncbi:hypothetical protein GCM10017083_41990 [Thalassobaculum fulvum]|uniref:Uncharacterized protein n=1 Tax=Thalassobaculum fulvum TaxID=1633335 RepID=A0A918XVG3_9PROT|nr:hypothetical protein [Thalassobaculum fulvum]GHD58675.1 hypothetical protein GCM10017083_41990 [Thalassobaculum fulvum]
MVTAALAEKPTCMPIEPVRTDTTPTPIRSQKLEFPLEVSVRGVVVPEFAQVTIRLIESINRQLCRPAFHVLEEKTFIKDFYIDKNGRMTVKHIGSPNYMDPIDDKSDVVIFVSHELFGAQYTNLSMTFTPFVNHRTSIKAMAPTLNKLHSRKTKCLYAEENDNHNKLFFVIGAEHNRGEDQFISCLASGLLAALGYGEPDDIERFLSPATLSFVMAPLRPPL